MLQSAVNGQGNLYTGLRKPGNLFVRYFGGNHATLY